MKATCTSAFLLTLLFVGGARAGEIAASTPPYKSIDILGFLNDQKVKAELRITKGQEKALKACLEKAQARLSRDLPTIFKMTGPDKEARVRALTKQRAEETFKSLGRVLSPSQLKRLKQILLQQWGIVLVDFPEIRQSLGLGDAQAARLHAIHDKLVQEVVKQMQDRRISQEEGQKQANILTKGVDPRVRVELSEGQRRTLDDLLGAPYRFQS